MHQLAVRFRISVVQPLQNCPNPRRVWAAPKRQTTCGFSRAARRTSGRASTAARRFRRPPRGLSRRAKFLFLVFLFCFGHQAEEYITRRALGGLGRAGFTCCATPQDLSQAPLITNHLSLATASLTPQKINSAQTATPRQATAARNETPSALPSAPLPKGYICANSPSRSSRPRANKIARPPPVSSLAARPSTANASPPAARTRRNAPRAQIAANQIRPQLSINARQQIHIESRRHSRR